MKSFKVSHLILTGFVLVAGLTGFFVAQAKHSPEALRAASPNLNSSSAIFTKDKTYRLKLLQTFGITQRWVDCKVLDTRDNWVKCDGIVYDLNGKPEDKFVGWLNTEYISWVQE